MNRRDYLRSTGALATFSSNSVLSVQQDSGQLDTIATDFFDSLPDSEDERGEAITDCANALCTAQRTVSEDVIESVRDGGASVTDFIRDVRFAVRTLNEYNVTTIVDESTVDRGERAVSEVTKYLPLLGSFNNLCDAACEVDTPDPSSEQVENFLFATIAFGIEVGLWTTGAPFSIAFRGTRFIANRTFLRFARYGCRGCVAMAMSEIHWAIRGTIYSDAVTQDNVQFIYEQIGELQTEAEDIGYDVDLDYTYEEISGLVEQEGGGGGAVLGPVESEGPIDELLDFNFNFDFSFSLPEIPDIPDIL